MAQWDTVSVNSSDYVLHPKFPSFWVNLHKGKMQALSENSRIILDNPVLGSKYIIPFDEILRLFNLHDPTTDYWSVWIGSPSLRPHLFHIRGVQKLPGGKTVTKEGKQIFDATRFFMSNVKGVATESASMATERYDKVIGLGFESHPRGVPSGMYAFIKRLIKEGKRFSEVEREVIRKFSIPRKNAGYKVWLVKRDVEGKPVGRVLKIHSSQAMTVHTQPSPVRGGMSLHTYLVKLMADLGNVLGFESEINAKLSSVSKSVPSTMQDRTVDVLWTGYGSNVPIEVQVHGSIDSLMRRLETIEPFSLRMMMVGNEQDLKTVQNEVEEQKPRAFRSKMVYLNQDDLIQAGESISKLLLLRGKIGL